MLMFFFQFYLTVQEINRLERERGEEAQKNILLELAKDKPILNRTHAGSKLLLDLAKVKPIPKRLIILLCSIFLL